MQVVAKAISTDSARKTYFGAKFRLLVGIFHPLDGTVVWLQLKTNSTSLQEKVDEVCYRIVGSCPLAKASYILTHHQMFGRQDESWTSSNSTLLLRPGGALQGIFWAFHPMHAEDMDLQLMQMENYTCSEVLRRMVRIVSKFHLRFDHLKTPQGNICLRGFKF